MTTTNDKFNEIQLAIETLRKVTYDPAIKAQPEMARIIKNSIDRGIQHQIDLFKGRRTAPVRLIYDRDLIDALPLLSVGYFEDTKGECSVKLSDGWSDGDKGPLTLWSIGETELTPAP